MADASPRASGDRVRGARHRGGSRLVLGGVLLLTHEGVPAADWNETHAGWLNVLFPLKAWVVHGVDLRNHDPERLWDDGFADQ